MFSVYHCIWLAICGCLLLAAVVWLRSRRPPLDWVLSVACVGCVLSEVTKVFSVIQLVPSSDGETWYPYLELQHLPLHLCSIQLVLIFYVRFAKKGRVRDAVLAFMYPTCMLGAFLALLMPSIYGSSIEAAQSFTHPLAYQYFLYHTMLIVVGGYIALSGQVAIRAKHYFSTLALLGGLAFASLYFNAMFAVPTYENGVLVSVDYTTNFMFTFQPPLAITLTELWQWQLYLAVIVLLAVVLLALCYLPFWRRERQDK